MNALNQKIIKLTENYVYATVYMRCDVMSASQMELACSKLFIDEFHESSNGCLFGNMGVKSDWLITMRDMSIAFEAPIELDVYRAYTDGMTWIRVTVYRTRAVYRDMGEMAERLIDLVNNDDTGTVELTNCAVH